MPYREWTGAFVPDPEELRAARQAAGQKPLGILLVRQLLPELFAVLAQARLELAQDVTISYIASGEELPLTPPGLEIVPLDHYTLGRRAAKLLFQLVDGRQSLPPPARVLVLPGMAEHLLEEQREG
jgi:DNA-binding LacI/PurR family transcriptional regulator